MHESVVTLDQTADSFTFLMLQPRFQTEQPNILSSSLKWHWRLTFQQLHYFLKFTVEITFHSKCPRAKKNEKTTPSTHPFFFLSQIGHRTSPAGHGFIISPQVRTYFYLPLVKIVFIHFFVVNTDRWSTNSAVFVSWFEIVCCSSSSERWMHAMETML